MELKLIDNKPVENWVYQFLTTTGSNKKLAEIMNEKGHWMGPIEIPLKNLKRCCGPEKEMKFYQPKEKFNRKVKKMIKSLKKGWKPAPLIVWYQDKELSIADGAHRTEALKKIKFKKYPTLIWFKDKENLKEYENNTL